MSETRELEAFAKSLIKTAAVQGVVTTWLSAMGVRLVENALMGKLRPELSPLGWSIALAIGALRAAKFVRLRARVKQDLQDERSAAPWRRAPDK